MFIWMVVVLVISSTLISILSRYEKDKYKYNKHVWVIGMILTPIMLAIMYLLFIIPLIVVTYKIVTYLIPLI